jgi:cell division protein FtsB
VTRGQGIALAVFAGGILFGAFGGEYGTFDWWQLRRQVKDEQSVIDQLTHQVDSLSREANALEHDPATQERVAREQFGMIRPGEILYRVELVKP